MHEQIAHDATVLAAKAAPAAAVIATGATGVVTWSDVAYMCTALYMLAQTLLLLPKYRKEWDEWRKRK